MRSLVLLVLALALGVLPAVANACMMSEEAKAELFRTFDTDKDGALSLEEYLAGEKARVKDTRNDAQWYTKRYKDMEAAGDGKVTAKVFSPAPLQKRCL